MAIVLQPQKKKTNWFVIGVFVFLLLVIIIGAYFLFFAPVPKIEVFIPTSLQSLNKITEEEFDPAQINAHPVLGNLAEYGDLPSVGNIGRDNPFLPVQ